MFLVTTADQRCLIQNFKGEQLLLGEWCCVYSDTKDIVDKVMPYPWANRELKKSDFIEIQAIYGVMLESLHKFLNQIHGVDESESYWELIVGAWLNLVIAIIYERYKCLSLAADKYSISNTLIFRSDINSEPANDYLDFSEKYISDEWNLFVYSKIIEYTKNIPFTYIEEGISEKLSVTDSSFKSNFKKKVKITVSKFFKIIPNNIYFSNSGFSSYNLMRLQVKLKQFPNPIPPLIDMDYNKADWKLRKGIPTSVENELINVMAKLIPLLMPKAYLESFKELRIKTLNVYPKRAKLINSGTSDISDDGFKIWAAEQRKEYATLTINQHGGCYGASELTQAENIQKKNSSKFYSWGWSDGVGVVPMPAPKLIKKCDKDYNSKGSVLLILFNHSRYSYWAQSFPIAEHMKEYFDEQLDFLAQVSKEVEQNVKIRYYPRDFGWEVEKRFCDGGYSGKKDKSSSLNEAINNARLCVATYNATTFLETLSAEIPTVIFWKTEHFPLRQSAVKWYEKLKVAGILHDGAESAANKINSVYRDPMSWWQQEEVKKARKEFCDHYAMTNDNWLDLWAKELKSMV